MTPGRYLRNRFPAIYFFLVAIINWFIRITRPHTLYITDSLGGSFKEYLKTPGFEERINTLKSGLDIESAATVDVMIARFDGYPDERFRKKIPAGRKIIGGLLPVESKESTIMINKELRALKKNLRFPSGRIEESVFYFYHGLRLLPERITEYIKGYDFIDAGAFIGDSAVALYKYGYRKIYSFEISPRSCKKYIENLAACGIDSGRYEIINMGISATDGEEPLIIHDTGSSGLSLVRRTGKYDEVCIGRKTIDFLAEKYRISPKFIKVDIEGSGLDFILGAPRTLTKYRPVISMAIYHNPREFFEIKPALEQILPGYRYMIRKLASGVRNNLCHSEVILLGYPEELEY